MSDPQNEEAVDAIGWDVLTAAVEGLPYLGSKWSEIQRVFGTPEAVLAASLDDLMQVRGVGESVAVRVHRRLRNLADSKADVAVSDPQNEEAVDAIGWDVLTAAVEGLPYLGSKWSEIQRVFGTPEAVLAASLDDLLEVRGIGYSLAGRIHRRLHNPWSDHDDLPEADIENPEGLPDSDRIFATVSQRLAGGNESIRVTSDPVTSPREYYIEGACFRIKVPGGVYVGDEWVAHIPHGMSPHDGARAPRGRRWVDSVGMVAMRIEGHTLEAIGDLVGLTRERVRQITMKAAPWRPWDAVAQERKLLREEARHNAKVRITCATCGGVFEDSIARSVLRAYCSTECREVFDMLRYHVDDERRNSHRLYAANWAVANPDRVPDIQLRAAERILREGPQYGSGARWLIEGSGPFDAAVRACREGWPVFGQLPTVIQVQVREHLGIEVSGVDRAKVEVERARRGSREGINAPDQPAAPRAGVSELEAPLATWELASVLERDGIVCGETPSESTGCFLGEGGWWYRFQVRESVLQRDELYAPAHAFAEAPLSRFVPTRLACGSASVVLSPVGSDGVVTISNVWAMTRECQAVEGDYVFLQPELKSAGRLLVRRIKRSHLIEAESALSRLVLEVGVEPAGSFGDALVALGLGATTDWVDAVALCERRNESGLADFLRAAKDERG